MLSNICKTMRESPITIMLSFKDEVRNREFINLNRQVCLKNAKLYLLISVLCFLLSPIYVSFSRETFYFAGGMYAANIVAIVICMIGAHFSPAVADGILPFNVTCRGLVAVFLFRLDFKPDCVPQILYLARNYTTVFMFGADIMLFRIPCLILWMTQIVIVASFELALMHI